MKEYCLISVVKPKCIAKLTITRYQYDEMTDKQIEKVISDYLKMNKINGDVKVINKDILTKVEDKEFVIICSTFTLYLKVFFPPWWQNLPLRIKLSKHRR